MEENLYNQPFQNHGTICCLSIENKKLAESWESPTQFKIQGPAVGWCWGEGGGENTGIASSKSIRGLGSIYTCSPDE